MIKYAPLKLEDTNMANFGTKLEKDIKAAAAKTEDAWKGCGEKEGIQMWRIEQFHVKNWGKEHYGSFFSGDSYILLHTYKIKGTEALHWQIHFWLGSVTP